MTVSLSPDVEKFVAEQIREGRYSNETEVLTAAVNALRRDWISETPRYPAGSLSFLYGGASNAFESQTLSASSLHVEEW